MAEAEKKNLPIAEEPEFITEIPAINPDDPVHFAQMNKILASLLGNDVFLDRLANKMIEKNLIAHVLDCENSQMVLGADQASVITGLIDGVKEDVTQLYSEIADGISVRYDQESDYIQIYNGQQWMDWMLAGLLFDGYLFLNGVYQLISGMDITWRTANAASQGYCNFGGTINIRSYCYNDGFNTSKYMYPILASKEAVNMKKYTKLSMRYSAYISTTDHYIDISLSLQQNGTKNTVRISSTVASVGELSINLPQDVEDIIVIEVSAPYNMGSPYGTDWYGYCNIQELRLL